MAETLLAGKNLFRTKAEAMKKKEQWRNKGVKTIVRTVPKSLRLVMSGYKYIVRTKR